MKKQLLLILALFVPIVALAGGDGYGETLWGMSPAQVVEAESGRAVLIQPQQYKSSWAKVKIDNVQIGGDVYTVNFLFDASDKLIQTNVVSNEKKNIGIAHSRFNTLSQLLTQKYGEPQFKNSDSITWKTSGTTIELNTFIIPNVMTQTSIRYIPNSKIESDTSNL